MKESIKDYIWFIKESQSFMKGVQSRPRTFIESLFRGFRFCKLMNEDRLEEGGKA